MKSRKSIRGLSPIFATLILIAIAVIAGIIVYMFTSGTLASMLGGGTTGNEKVAIQAVSNATTTLSVWAKSTAGTDVDIDAVIIKDSGGATLAVIPLTTPVRLPKDGTLTKVDATVVVTYFVKPGVYTATLTSKNGGSFVSSSFSPS